MNHAALFIRHTPPEFAALDDGNRDALWEMVTARVPAVSALRSHWAPNERMLGRRTLNRDDRILWHCLWATTDAAVPYAHLERFLWSTGLLRRRRRACGVAVLRLATLLAGKETEIKADGVHRWDVMALRRAACFLEGFLDGTEARTAVLRALTTKNEAVADAQLSPL